MLGKISSATEHGIKSIDQAFDRVLKLHANPSITQSASNFSMTSSYLQTFFWMVLDCESLVLLLTV